MEQLTTSSVSSQLKSLKIIKWTTSLLENGLQFLPGIRGIVVIIFKRLSHSLCHCQDKAVLFKFKLLRKLSHSQIVAGLKEGSFICGSLTWTMYAEQYVSKSRNRPSQCWLNKFLRSDRGVDLSTLTLVSKFGKDLYLSINLAVHFAADFQYAIFARFTKRFIILNIVHRFT